jgi:hypothetical protein
MLLEEAKKEQKRFPGNVTEDQNITTTAAVGENNNQGQYTKMCGLIKTMFEKISTLLFDQETVSKLLKLIFERVSNGKESTGKKGLFFDGFSFVEPEQPASYYENINQLLKVCRLEILGHSGVFSLLSNSDFTN